MKYILLIFMVFIVILKVKSIMNLFKTEEYYQSLMPEALTEAQQFWVYGKDAFFGFLIVISLATGLGYLVFYTFSMIYVANIWFSIFSAFQIAWTFRCIGKNIKAVANIAKSETVTKPKTRPVVANVIVELAYIGYLLSFIIQKW